MPRHFLGLTGAATVATEPLRLAHRVVADLMDAGAMGVIHGEAGLGKTFAVDDALHACPTVTEACWTSFPSRPTMRQVALDLLGLLTRAHHAGTRFQATHELIEALADRPRLVVIDEHFAHGNWRNWAAFTHTAVALAVETGHVLDEALVRNVFALHGGGTDLR